MNNNRNKVLSIHRKGKVLLIYTGGTIGMGCDQQTGALEPLDFNHLVERVPEFKQLPTDVDTYQFNPPIDSSDMSPSKWIQIARIVTDRYDQYDGFVILHGNSAVGKLPYLGQLYILAVVIIIDLKRNVLAVSVKVKVKGLGKLG